MSRWQELLENINTWKRGNERAVHKPLLTLILLGRAQRGAPRQIHYREVNEQLRDALREFGPPRKSYHPEFPFFYLKNDGYWTLGEEPLPYRRGKSQSTPRTLIDQDVTGEVPETLWNELAGDPTLTQRLIRQVLDDFWPESYHDDLVDFLGLELAVPGSRIKRRDPRFRLEVLRAYERRCAVRGFNARIADSLIGLEAAHIQFVQFEGPDVVPNGLALCSLHHKAFDRGAIGLSSELRLLVSQDLTGDSVVEETIIRFSGQRIREPQLQTQRPSPEYVQWHHENVFREPARA